MSAIWNRVKCIADQFTSAVPRSEIPRARALARSGAPIASEKDSWLEAIRDHHVLIEQAFEAVLRAKTAVGQTRSQQTLGILLTAHFIAEETAVFPVMAQFGQKANALLGYAHHAAAKLQLGQLEYLLPLSDEYLGALRKLRTAVLHNMHVEEGTWFPTLHSCDVGRTNHKLSRNYKREFTRYFESISHIAIPGVQR